MTIHTVVRLGVASLTCCIVGAQAATFTVRNKDGAGEGLNDPTPVAAVGGNTGTTRGQQRLNALNEALRRWGALIDSPQTFIVDATFDPLECSPTSGTLASAGPYQSFRDFPAAPKPNTFYPSALTDALSGEDYAARNPATANDPDIVARFNYRLDSDPGCLGQKGFYYGFNQLAGTKTDLIEVALHEIGHGLGFTSRVDLTTGQGAIGADGVERFSIYDHFIQDDSLALAFTALTPTQRLAAARRTNFLVWTGANANTRINRVVAGFTPMLRLKLYAPATIEPGSSVSHWDTSMSPDLLMEPNDTAVVNATTDLTVCLLRDLGYKTTRCPDPANNSAPTVQPLKLTIDEDSPGVNLTLAATDADKDPLDYTIVSNGTRGTAALVIPPSPLAQMTYKPNANANGIDALSVAVHDGVVASTTAAVEVTIRPVNDAPTATALTASGQAGSAIPIALTGADVDGDALSYAVVTQPTHGTLSGSAPNLTYRSNASFSGTDSFTYRATDASLSSSPATVMVAVTPAPAAANASGGGGGGAFNILTVLGIAILALLRAMNGRR